MRLLALAALIALAASSVAQDSERRDIEHLRDQCVDIYRAGDSIGCFFIGHGYPGPFRVQIDEEAFRKCEEVVTSCRIEGLWPFQAIDTRPLVPRDLEAPERGPRKISTSAQCREGVKRG
jgi:hypothetical protein